MSIGGKELGVRYPPDQKEKARAVLLEAGVEQMKANGFNGIGVDGIAGAAGVTSGAFYSNFANKAEMLAAIIETYLGQFSDTPDSPHDDIDGLKDFLAYYIGDAHCLDVETGCVMPALSEDVARHPAAQAVYDRQATAFATRIANALGGDPQRARQRGWSLVALMVGAVTVSRAMVPGSPSQQQALRAGLAAAIDIVDDDDPRHDRSTAGPTRHPSAASPALPTRDH
ncbi:MAG: TetR/AcrR family transcriptional regulator [Solirubrobacteraceae bacterium]